MAQSLFLENDNPVDFLYLDRQRISSFMGQLSERGVLTGYKSTVSKTQTREGHATGQIPLVASGDIKAARVSMEAAEETYDPFWVGAYTFLQDLEANYAVPTDKARLGSLIKFEAMVQFVDLGLMKNLWGPAVRSAVQAQQEQQAQEHPKQPSTQQAFSRRQRAKDPPAPDPSTLLIEILGAIPHLLHMTFLATGTPLPYLFWASARREYLTIPSEDLAMKYGAALDGIWAVVGILDAMPGPRPEPLFMGELLTGVIQSMENVRAQVGRPTTHFGLTPIAIYAPMRGVAEVEVASEPGSAGPPPSKDREVGS
jgi:hypothetical protein